MSYSDDQGVLEQDAKAAPSTDEPVLHTDDLVGTRERGAGAGTTPEPDDADDGYVLVADAQAYRDRWETIQSGFVDEPREAVEQADTLVAEVVRALIDAFSDERKRLEGQWSAGEEVSTEDLRVALKRYRSFFERLLTR